MESLLSVTKKTPAFVNKYPTLSNSIPFHSSSSLSRGFSPCSVPLATSFTVLCPLLLQQLLVVEGACSDPPPGAVRWSGACGHPHAAEGDGCWVQVQRNCIWSIGLCAARPHSPLLDDLASRLGGNAGNQLALGERRWLWAWTASLMPNRDTPGSPLNP